MKRFLGGLILIVTVLTFIPALPVAAQGSTICNSSSCTKEEVGAFMMGITARCGNEGNCELSDIMIVISNIGNWVLGVVGAVVFLVYVYAGVLMIGIPGWSTTERTGKAKKMLVGATVGLMIVLFSYVGIYTLRSVLVSGSLKIGVTEGGKTTNYAACDSSNDTEVCDLNSICYNGICTSQCLITHKNKPGEVQWDCVDTRDGKSPDCTPDLCPGEASVMCCPVN